MILSYGVLESSRRRRSRSAFGSIDELFARRSAVDPAALDLPADYLTRWQGSQPTRLWRNANLSPDFTLVGAGDGGDVHEARPGCPVDGVIQIDPAGLAAILKGTGPVERRPASVR